tara:strand:- start:286 stop:714 length:429 start_codon:yes stop_codon:yes gene_type:complete
MSEVIPIVSISAGIIVSIGAFIWLYYEGKSKRETILEMAKHLDDPFKVEKLIGDVHRQGVLQVLGIPFEERKKDPIDYRRAGVIMLFLGIGIYLLGVTALGSLSKGIGLLVGTIGVGTMVAGYLYPNTSEELTNAVEKFEEK